MGSYSIGVDFGTLSARAVLAELETGKIVAESTRAYPHGVISGDFFGAPLPEGWALQHPMDYIECLTSTVAEVRRLSGVPAREVVGLGIDFTACTMLPVDEEGTPLCCKEEFSHEPHAYVKLWKHHAAEREACMITEAADKNGEPWLAAYGGKVSSEWLYPKVWNILNEAPEVYTAAARFMEAADWLTYYLTGEYSRSVCFAGYKAFWDGSDLLTKNFLASLDARLERVNEEKIDAPIKRIGECAGTLCPAAAEAMGLLPETRIAVPIIDAHAGVLAANVSHTGQMLIIIGTSSCHLMASEEKHLVPGICGVVKDGILPGLYAYEAGQACVGDHFLWFVENCCPAAITEEATRRGMDVQQYLTEKAEKLRPGESGLVALDWWNGCRSTLVDSELTGAIFGMTLSTKPEEIYRALIEATAFGTRVIVENFIENGVPVDEIIATGGVSRKNQMLMQIYADVLNMPIAVCGAAQGGALGAAILGAAASGRYADVRAAVKTMSAPAEKTYYPDKDSAKIYKELYDIYKELYIHFGKDSNSALKRLGKLEELE